MERFESLGPVGEGSYGTVLKCRHRDSGRLVAIKKFMDSDGDKTVKKIALREIRLLRQLRHDNLVNLLEVWRRRHRWYLVFEFVDRTLLDDLEQNPNGLDLNTGRQYLYQILRAADFCHQQNVIHRDIKPENILISQEGVVKLCDFGFARTVASPSDGGVYTDYVATRWYRAPELLVGDIKYGKPVDVWAVGCLLLEVLTGQPLFPGESDLDQIYHIVRCFGNLTAHHQEVFYRNPVFTGVKLPECSGIVPLQQRFPSITPTALDLAKRCLEMDPGRRAQCSELLEHPLFTQDSFHIRFLEELNAKIQKEHRENSTLPKITKTPRQEKDEGNQKNCKGKDRKHGDMREKINKEKMEKPKGKQPSKVSKTNCSTSEPLVAKQCKTLGHKAVYNAVQCSMTMKRKPGKATGAELRKESDISKPTKTLISESADAARTTTTLKNSNPVAAKPKQEAVVPPQPRNELLKNRKDVDCSGPDAEMNIMKIRGLSKSEPSQEFAKTRGNANSKVPKLPKTSITHCQNLNSPPKAALEPVGDQKNTSLALQCFQLSSNTSVTAPTKSCKKTAESQGADAEQRSSDCTKLFTPTCRTLKTTSNTGPKTTKNSSSILTGVSRTLTSGLPEHPSIVFLGAGPAHSTPGPPRRTSEMSKTGCTSKTLSKVRELSEDRSSEKNHGSTSTAADLIVMSHAAGVIQKDPESTKISSASKPNENKPEGTTVLKPAASDQDNRDDLTVPASVSSTTSAHQSLQVSGSSGDEPRNNSSDVESDLKSLRTPHPKQNLMKPGCFSNHLRSTGTPKTLTTRFAPEARSDNPEKHDTADVSTAGDLTSVLAATRSSVLQKSTTSDLSQSDFTVPQSSTPPPPPPPPSSTPLLLAPSSTSQTSFLSVTSSSPAGFHPGSPSLRCVEMPEHHGGPHGRQAQQFEPNHITGSFTFKASDNSPLCEQPVHANPGNSSSVAGAQIRSHVHFSDLRSSMLLELRGREAEHSKSTAEDQQREEHLVPSSPPPEPQQHGHDSDTCTPNQAQ